jgi:SAM-dependent methyltransferase
MKIEGHLELPKPVSITHLHILSTLNTLYHKQSYKNTNVIRILDAGCGDGSLIEFLLKSLVLILCSEGKIEIYGFDVTDHGVQEERFLFKTIKRLSDNFPEVSWSERVRPVEVGDSWPFENDFFDFVVSNQVLEHIHDKRHFFQNTARTLKSDGYSINVAPLRHCVHEGHIYLPWAHRFRNHAALLAYIYACSTLRLGKYPSHHKATGVSKLEFSERHADYIFFWTSYSTESETLEVARDCSLRGNFSYSIELYTTKIRSIFGLPFQIKYKNRYFGLSDAILIKLLRYLSSVTFICHKRNTY